MEEHATSEANFKGSRHLGTNRDMFSIEDLNKKGILCHTKECGHHPEGTGGGSNRIIWGRGAS